MGEPTMAWKAAAGVLVVVHGPVPPSEDDWDAHVRFVEERIDSMMGIMIVSEGGHPSSLQRARLAEVMGPRASPRTTLITQSMKIRGIMAAMRWLSVVKDIRTFAPARMTDAYEYLDVPPTHAKRIESVLDQLRAEVEFQASPAPS